jgi:hypothetical protein
MNSKVGYLLIFDIISQLTKPSPFTSLVGWFFVSLDFTFMIMLGSKEIAIIYSLPSKVPQYNIHNKSTYKFTELHPWLLTKILMEKGA